MWCSACEIRGRLRCSAASVGYRGRIWKAFVHSPVTPLSRNLCQARNYHRRGIRADQGRGRELRVRRPRQGFSSRERALGRGVFPCFSKKRKIQERAGGLHGSTETQTTCLAVGP